MADLEYNPDELSPRYNKDAIVAEYAHLKREVNELSFNITHNRGKGSRIRDTNEYPVFFYKNGKVNEHLHIYDEMYK